MYRTINCFDTNPFPHPKKVYVLYTYESVDIFG